MIKLRHSLVKKRRFTMLPCIFIFLLCLCFPKITGTGMRNGLYLIADQVIPALYPFILLTTAFKYLSHKKNSNTLMLVIAFLSGYPLGASIIATYGSPSRHISDQSMLLICNNPSPAYMISFVGSYCLGRPEWGICMYIVILISNVLAGVFFSYLENCRSLFPYQESVQKVSLTSVTEHPLNHIIHDTFNSVVSISSYILVFSVAAAFIAGFPFLTKSTQGIISGILEMTTGIYMLQTSGITENALIFWMTGLISFGGLSVIAQTKNMISGTHLSIKKYMAEKALATSIALTAMYILLSLYK